jgi:broad specificity phosphatase PhoE
MTRLYVVRHGETPWNVEGRYQGQLDPPLTEKGERQAQATAQELAAIGFEAIYSSGLTRARQTAEVLANRLAMPIRFDRRLREINQGAWEGVVIDDIRAHWPDEIKGWETDPWRHHPPGGETLYQLQARVYTAIDEIAQAHRQPVAIFTHKLPMALLRIRYQRHAPEAVWSLLPKNAAWEIFEV